MGVVASVLLVVGLHLRQCGAACLQDAANLSIPVGGTALRIVCGNWDSSAILGRIAQIILSEGIGLAAELHATNQSSAEHLHDIAGCADASCSRLLAEPRFHMSFESWALNSELDDLLDRHPESVMVNPVGFYGEEALYFKQSVVQNVSQHHDSAIEYYRTFTFRDRPWLQHFAPPSEVRFPPGAGCRGPAAELLAERGMACSGDGWWFPAACDADRDACTPVFVSPLARPRSVLQFCKTIQDLGLAMAVALWPDADMAFLDAPRAGAFYAFWPDWHWNSLYPLEQIVFPRHSAGGWTDDFESSGPRLLKKIMWPGVEAASMQAATLFQNFRLTGADMQQMMAQMYARAGAGDSNLTYSIACEWVQANSATWRMWFPPVPVCNAGDGLEDRICRRCPKGTFSKYVPDTSTRFCKPCPAGELCAEPGTAQPASCPRGHYCPEGSHTASPCPPGTAGPRKGAGSRADCDLCGPGTFSAEKGYPACFNCSTGQYLSRAGGVRCNLCPMGRMQASPGQSSCQRCAPGSSAGEAGMSECVLCPPGHFSEAPGDGEDDEL